jgi:hypothetical protein
MVESQEFPDESPSIKIQVAGQALRYLENCDDEEFHFLRGEIILLSTNPQINNRDIVALPRPPAIFRVYRGERYRITFYMNDPETMVVLNIEPLAV